MRPSATRFNTPTTSEPCHQNDMQPDGGQEPRGKFSNHFITVCWFSVSCWLWPYRGWCNGVRTARHGGPG